MERWDVTYTSAHRQSSVGLVARCTRSAVAALFLVVASVTTPAHAAAPTAPSTCSASFASGSLDAPKASGSDPQITLNIASAASGSQIVVRGTGWPTQAQVIIGIDHFVQTNGVTNAFDGVSHATVTSAGTFTAQTFSLPFGMCGALPRAGTVAKIVAHTPDEQTRVTAPLSIVQTPTITVPLTISNLSPGTTTIPVNGSDWAPDSAVSLVAATTQPNCAPATSIDVVRCLTALPGAQAIEAHAEANGHFSVNIPIPPALAPGTSVLVRAAITAPPYGDLVLQSAWYGVIPLSITPTLTLDRQTGPAGTTVAVSGNHWPSGKLVIVEYCRREAVSQNQEGIACNQGSLGVVTTGYAQELGETAVDTTGHFSTHVTLPGNARPGSVMFQVRVKITDPTDGIYTIYAQTASFTVTSVKTDQQATTPWWPFAGAGGILIILIGLVLWRRGALPGHVAR